MDSSRLPAKKQEGGAERRRTLFTFLFVYAVSILNNTALSLLLEWVRADITLSGTVLPYLVFYLRNVLSVVWLYCGATAVARAVCLRRAALSAVSALLLFGAMELTDFLPLLLVSFQYDSQSVGSLISSNFDGLLMNTLFYLLRVLLAIGAGLCAPWLAGKGKKRRDPLLLAGGLTAAALTLLPIAVEVFGNLIPFLRSAGINQIRAEAWKLVLEYLLYLLFGLLGYAAIRVYLVWYARKRETAPPAVPNGEGRR